MPHKNTTKAPLRFEGEETRMLCSRCREWKIIDEFALRRSGKYGRQGYCRGCSRNAQAEWRARRLGGHSRVGFNIEPAEYAGLVAAARAVGMAPAAFARNVVLAAVERAAAGGAIGGRELSARASQFVASILGSAPDVHAPDTAQGEGGEQE